METKRFEAAWVAAKEVTGLSSNRFFQFRIGLGDISNCSDGSGRGNTIPVIW